MRRKSLVAGFFSVLSCRYKGYRLFFPLTFGLFLSALYQGCTKGEENTTEQTSPVESVQLPKAAPGSSTDSGVSEGTGATTGKQQAPERPSAEAGENPTAGVAASPPTHQAPSSSKESSVLTAYARPFALNVRSGPSSKKPVVGILLKNDQVTITNKAQEGKSTWYAITAAGGYVDGWVNSRYLAFTPPSLTKPQQEVDYGAPQTPTLVKGPSKYIGADACKKCHVKSTGAFPKGAYPVWKDHVHSAAFRSLSLLFTREVAKRLRQVEDPAHDWRCLKCHETAYGADPSQVAASYRNADGVSCEACHGPGSAYAEVNHGPSNPERYKLGFYKLTNLREREALCVSCHNPASPTYKPFNILAFSRDIQHWPDQSVATYFQHAEESAKEHEKAVQEKTPTEKPEQQGTGTERQLAEERAKDEQTERERAAAEQRAKAEQAKQERATGEQQAKAEQERIAAEQRAKAAQAEQEAQAALQQQAEVAKTEAERQKKMAAAAHAPTGKSGLEHHLTGLADVLTLNTDGEKYQPVRFTHAAHASKNYVPGIQCQTCHHTQKADEKPEKCQKCHNVGGEAGETSPKTLAAHSKEKGFPKASGQEEVSCLGCHLSQNELLTNGGRSGKEAPTKCNGCHERKGV